MLGRYVEVPVPIPPVITFGSPESWGVIEQACVVDAEGRFYPIDLRSHAAVDAPLAIEMSRLEALFEPQRQAWAKRIDRDVLDLYAGLR